MIDTKHQQYTYSLKSAAFTEDGIAWHCGESLYFYLTPPEDAISVENIITHFSIQFSSDIPAEYQKVCKVGIINTFPGMNPITYKRFLQIDKVADANRVVDFTIDLTKLLKKDNVEFWDGSAFAYPSTGTFVFIDFPTGSSDYDADGTMYQHSFPEPPGEQNQEGFMLWKVDALYITKGIR